MRRQRGRVGLMAAALVGILASGAAADVTTERSASVLVFPKVIADSSRDTIIQITNTSNSMVHAHCFYVNGALTFPDLDPGPLNPPLWTEVDFDIWLTKQQPTHWVVSQGRLVDPTDPPCNPGSNSCSGAGIDPGRVPPVVEDFTGELKCVEVDASGAPLSGNHLKGEATLVARSVCLQGSCAFQGNPCEEDEDCATGDVAKYNGLGVIGLETNDGNGVLCLGGEPNDSCPNGAEYNACPQTWILNHVADSAVDPVVGDDVCEDDTCTISGTSCESDADCTGSSEVTTNITVVPCAQNFETQDPTSVIVQFSITNEFEQTFSASTTVTCWADLQLSSINQVFSRSFVGSDYLQTRMRPSAGTASGFMVVGEEFHTASASSGSSTAAAAVNLHVEGTRAGPDLIVIPSEQIQ